MGRIIAPTMPAIRRDKGSGEQPHWVPAMGKWRARYVDADGRQRAVTSSKPGGPVPERNLRDWYRIPDSE